MTPNRTLRVLALSALATLLVGAAVAQAHHGTRNANTTKITGGTTTVALSDAAKTALSTAGIAATPIDPATASGDSLVFPIAGGKVKTDSFHGVVFHRGGIKLTKGDTTAKVKNLTLVNTDKGAAIFATTGGHHRFRFAGRHHKSGHGAKARAAHFGRGHHRVVKLFELSNVVRNGNTLTANATLTKSAAELLDKKFKTDTFKGGEAVGTVTVAATVA